MATAVPLQRLRTGLAITTLLAALSGCGGDKGSEPGSAGDLDAFEPVNIGGDGDLFDPDRLLQVDVTMAPEDFATLRNEGRSLADTVPNCTAGYEYTEFPGTVTIDGDTLNQVAIRTKGFLGSLSRNRPSLKFDFDELVKGRTYQNTTRMTLNNNRQDASNARQCMAYELFRKAGLPAPLCNFARVTVNGEDLGTYTHVEPIKKPFLERAFGDKSGNLYESQTADFGTYLNNRFEKKTNEKEGDRSDLEPIAAALELDDDGLQNTLPQLINVDQFIRLWALETLTGSWDSATGNANNFYLYRNPGDQLFHFIPWGADTAFTGSHPLKPGTGPLFRNFRIAQRMYEIEPWRNQYEARLQEYLNTLWDEESLLAELARIRDLTGTTEAEQRHVIGFITGQPATDTEEALPSQRERLTAALAGQSPEQRVSVLEDQPEDCSPPAVTRLSGTVTSKGGTDGGSFKFSLPDGTAVDASLFFASFEVDSLVYRLDESTNPAMVSLQLIGADAASGFTPYVLQLFVESPDFTDGQHELHGFATSAILLEVDESLPEMARAMALGASGTFTLSGANGFSGEDKATDDLAITFDITLEYAAEFEEAQGGN